MNENWDIKLFSDLIEIIGGGTPKTSVEEYWDGDIPWISIKDFNNDFKHIKSTEKTITQSGLDNSSTKILYKGDSIISARGTVGKIAMIDSPMAFNQSCYGIRPLNFVDSGFIYYLLKYNVNMLKNNTHGSVFDTITTNTFDNIIVSVPPLEEQMKINKILSNIDDKIEVNKQINQNLKLQLESLFTSWFFNFDIFGEDDLKDSEFGKIPIGWDVVSLGDVTTRIKDKVGTQKLKVLSAVNSGKLQLSEEYFSKQVFSKNIEKYLVVNEKEFAYNPARINIGSIGINDLGFSGCVSPVYVAFKSEEGYENFINMFIKTSRFNKEVNLRAYGSVRQSLNYEDFSLIRLVYPSKKYIDKFNLIYDNYFEVINQNIIEIRNLEKLRDTLLPKLMSGEIDVYYVNLDDGGFIEF